MRKILAITLPMLFIVSCENFMSSNYMSDDALIEAIQNDPYKVEVAFSSMPQKSQGVIVNNYFDHYAYSAELSTDHGYQVTMGDEYLDYGDIREVYFTKDGRELGARSADDRGKGGHKKRCFRFVFPLSFTFSDGSSHTVNDKDEFRAALKAQYEATGQKERPAFTYPIQVQFKDREEATTINSDEELKEAFQACRGEGNDKKCFTFVFPVSFTMPDGSTLTADDEEDLAEKMKAFWDSYDGEKKRPQLNFPVDLQFEDGTVLTVNSKEEMRQAWKDNCRRKGGGDEGEGGSGGGRG